MTDDDFEDLLDQVHYYFPLRHDRYARAEYERVIARVANTGGEEQRAQLEELIEGLAEEQDKEAEDAADAAREQDAYEREEEREDERAGGPAGSQP